MPNATNDNSNDPFAWRSGGMAIRIGDDENDGMVAMISADNKVLTVMKRSIHWIQLADSIDPNRTNPAIPHSQQKILPYGGDDAVVCRTLLQADELFKDRSQPDNVNSEKAISIALSFLQEVVSLRGLATDYISKEKEKNTSPAGAVRPDQSLHIPSISNIEQTVKQFIGNADHAGRHLIEMAQLFYPQVKNSSWGTQLAEELTRQNHTKAASFVKSANDWGWRIRNMRNAIEHTDENNKIHIQNYKLGADGKITLPSVSLDNPNTPLPLMPVSEFMLDAVERLQLHFEVLMAYLCNIHARPFGRDARLVIEIPETNRLTHKKYMRFQYHIDFH